MSHTDSALQRTSCSLALDGRTHARYSESASRLVARQMGLGHSRGGRYALQVASDMLDVARCVASACCWMLHANARALCACAATAAAPGDILRAAAKHRARNLADRTLCGYSVRTLHVALLTLRRAFSCCLRTQPVPSPALPMLARPRHHSAPTARTVPQSPHGPPQYRRL